MWSWPEMKRRQICDAMAFLSLSFLTLCPIKRAAAVTRRRRRRRRYKNRSFTSMAVTASSPTYLRKFDSTISHFSKVSPAKRSLTIVSMAPKKKVNKYDPTWKKQWFGAGIFLESTEEVEVDVFKKLEQKKVLSNVEKAGLLSKAEELGFTLSSIEKLGVFSKAEELGLLSLLEKVAGYSPATLASVSLPLLVGAILAVVFIPDDSAGLVVAQAVLASALGLGAVGLFVGSAVLEGIQEAD